MTEGLRVGPPPNELWAECLVSSLNKSPVRQYAVVFTYHGSQIVGTVVTTDTLTWTNQHREEISVKSVSVRGIDHSMVALTCVTVGV